MGVALIDVGRGSTTVSVFAEGTLIGINVTPLGGDNVTKDRSIGLRTTTEDAEDIKLKHGHAFYDTANEEETFEVPTIGSNTKESYNQLQIIYIIEASV